MDIKIDIWTLTAQEWLINLALFPILVASITVSASSLNK